MNCININHPEFKNLVFNTKENPQVLAAYVSTWMEETNNDRFPTKDEIKSYTKNALSNSLFYSIDAIKQLAMMYNMDNSGFMSSMVNPDAIRNTIIRKGIADLKVEKARTGSYYFKYKGKFLNPFKQYQLENQEEGEVNQELSDKLMDWAALHGIKIEAMEEMLSRLNMTSETSNGAVAVADLLNKIISIDPAKEKMDTFAEEISHFATAILKDDASFKKAMESITDTELYKQVKETYKNVYSTEEQFKKETVDKLLAKAIVENFQTTEENKGFLPYLKAIFDKFWKWVNKNIKGTDAETQIKESLYPIAQRILSGEYMGEVEQATQSTVQPTSGVKEGVSELFASNPELANQVYETLGFNQLITPNDKIVFGHPTIGKSYLKNQGENKFISLDDDYATEINNKVKEIADKYNVTTYQVKDGGTQKWNNEYNQMMQEMFNVAKQRAISENKTLFTSNTNLLRNNKESFDKVINLTDIEFEKRIKERGAKYDIKEWKSQINEVISKIPISKVITTDKYLSNLFITLQQKQQAQQLYSQYLDTIFPDSKVKDIVYHNSPNKFDKFDNLKIGTTTSGVGSEDRFLGIFFTSDKESYEGFNIKGFQYPSILNLKNPINGGINYNNLPDLKTEEDFKNYQKQLIKDNYDGIEYGKSFLDFEEGGYQNPILEAIVFEPEQIHILGNKQDIEGFKKFIKKENTFFQLEEEEPLEFSEDPAKPELKSEMEVTKEFLEETLDILYERLEKFTRSSGIKKQTTIESLQNKIIKLKSEIQNNQFEQGVLGVLELINSDLNTTLKVLKKHNEEGTVNTNTTDMASNFVEIYDGLLTNFSIEIRRHSFNEKTETRLFNYINESKKALSDVQRELGALTQRDVENVLVKANTDENGEKIDKDFDEKSILKNTESDLSVLRFWAGNFKNSKSSIIRAAFKLIHNSNIKVKRKAIEVAQELIAAQELMEKSGVKVKELIEKDSNGRPTQYLIREKNWAPYVEAKIKMQEELTKTLKFEEWMDVISAVRNKELSPEKLNIFKNTINKFQKDYPLVTVRDEKGNFLYKEPREKNPKFEELMKNPLVKNYYDLLLKHRKEALDKLPLKYRKPANLYLLPGIRAQFIEKMFRADVPFHKNLAQIVAESLVRDQDDTEFGDERRTINNKMVPIYFTRRFRNEELSALSTDLTRSFTIFSEMAENLKEKGKLSGDLSTIQRQIGSRKYIKKGDKTPGAASNEFKALQFMLDSYVFGIEKKDIEFWKMGDNKVTRALGVANKSFSLSKLTDKFTRFIRNNNLALNIPTSLAGYLKGNVDTLIEDQLGEYTTIESKNWARLEYGKNLGQVIAQIGKKTQTNKMHLLLRRNRVVDLNSILSNTERSKLTSTLLNSDMLYVNYKTGDYGLKGRVALAVYHNTRLVDGKFLDKADFRRLRRKEGKQEKEINKEWKSLEDKNLYNAFEVKNAQLVIKDEFKPFVTEGLENKIFSRIEYTANTIDGTMSDIDRGALSREIGGEFFLMHRGWFINMIDSRVRWFTSVDLMSGKEETGYYRALYDYVVGPIKQDGYKAMATILSKNYWKETKADSPGRAKGVKKALLDLLYLNVLGLIGALVNAAADDDEEENYALQFSAYILNRVLLEHSAGNPVLNPSEILQIIDEPVVGVRMIKDLVDLSEAWNPEIYESGMYENWSHREKWWFRKSAVLKNLYEVQFPELKNRFIKNQILDSYIYDKIKKDEDESMGVFERLKAILISDHDADPIDSYNIINEEYED